MLMPGNGCGSVGWEVASDTIGLRFESINWQEFILMEQLFTVYWKDENKEKQAGDGQFFLKKLCLFSLGKVYILLWQFFVLLG